MGGVAFPTWWWEEGEVLSRAQGLLQPLTPARGPGPPSLWPGVPTNV